MREVIVTIAIMLISTLGMIVMWALQCAKAKMKQDQQWHEKDADLWV